MLAIAVVREGDTLAVPKLDRPARFAPDVRAIADRPRERVVKLGLGRTRKKLHSKQPKLSDGQRRELCRKQATGEYSISDLAELFYVSRPTVYRTLNRRHSP